MINAIPHARRLAPLGLAALALGGCAALEAITPSALDGVAAPAESGWLIVSSGIDVVALDGVEQVPSVAPGEGQVVTIRVWEIARDFAADVGQAARLPPGRHELTLAVDGAAAKSKAPTKLTLEARAGRTYFVQEYEPERKVGTLGEEVAKLVDAVNSIDDEPGEPEQMDFRYAVYEYDGTPADEALFQRLKAERDKRAWPPGCGEAVCFAGGAAQP